MGEDCSAAAPETVIGNDRDVTALAHLARRGGSVLVVGPPGSGRSHLLRTVAAELQRTGTPVVSVTPSTALSDVPFGALTATGHGGLAALGNGSLVGAMEDVVFIDDVDALDIASSRMIARAVASRRLTAVVGMRSARARSVDRPDDSAPARRLILDLWLEGQLHRVDLAELSDADALDMIGLLPDADVLDSVTVAGIVWRADGSRALLRELAVAAIDRARAGSDPLSAAREIAPSCRLAIALDHHVEEFPRADLECLATVWRLPHLEYTVATRLFDADVVAGLVESGRLHAATSARRLLTANDLIAHEAQRRLGDAHVDAIIAEAGCRMLAEADEWWSPAIAVAISERWHRLGAHASDERAHSPAIRARVALDAARDANDRGDAAHAAAHAARGLRAGDDPALRVEADLAARAATAGVREPSLGGGPDVRRRLERSRALAESGVSPHSAFAIADERVDAHLAKARDARAGMDGAALGDAAARALAEDAASPAARLRALTASGAAAVLRGDWSVALSYQRDMTVILDARPRIDGVSIRDRLAATMSMLAAHHLAGADGAAMRERLEREIRTAAREGGIAELAMAGAAAAIGFVGCGRPEESRRELHVALSRDPSALGQVDVAMIELGVAEELAIGGNPAAARTLLQQILPVEAPLVSRSRLYVETTILSVEGRRDDARRTARAAADFTRGGDAIAFRVRDLARLVALGVADECEVDELVQIAATTDLPVSVTALRRAASAESQRDDEIPVDELRLHALWSVSAPERRRRATVLRRRKTAIASRRTAPVPLPAELTPREHEIAVLADQGLTNRQIAARLFLSIRTVESHIYQARMKVGAASRRELGRVVARGVAGASGASGASGVRVSSGGVGVQGTPDATVASSPSGAARPVRGAAAGSPKTAAAGSPKTAAAGSPRGAAAGSPRGAAAGSPRGAAARSPRGAASVPTRGAGAIPPPRRGAPSGPTSETAV